MANTHTLTTMPEQLAGAMTFSADFGAEFIKENLPVEKRSELAAVAQYRRLDLTQDIAERTVRMQASSVDMDQTLMKAEALSRMKCDYVIQSKYHTASGQTELTVRSHSPVILIVLGIAGLIVVSLLLRELCA